MHCRKYAAERRSFVAGLQRLGRVINSVKNVIEAAETAKGRKLLILFLKETGLYSRVLKVYGVVKCVKKENNSSRRWQ